MKLKLSNSFEAGVFGHIVSLGGFRVSVQRGERCANENRSSEKVGSVWANSMDLHSSLAHALWHAGPENW